jgi:hypothetical protein
VSDDALELDLKGYTNGIYTLKVIDGRTCISQSSKLVKQ